jgi:hypothetical protein
VRGSTTVARVKISRVEPAVVVSVQERAAAAADVVSANGGTADDHDHRLAQ